MTKETLTENERAAIQVDFDGLGAKALRIIDAEPTSSVAVALDAKAAAHARRAQERQQDWQMFIRQEAPRFMAAAISFDRGPYADGPFVARKAVQFAQDLWNALPAECKL